MIFNMGKNVFWKHQIEGKFKQTATENSMNREAGLKNPNKTCL